MSSVNHRWIWRLEREIPSDAEAGRQIVCEILEQLQEQGWCHDDVYGVHLALDEALVNAIKHGNGLSSQKRVNIACDIAAELVRIRVADEGAGFQPDAVPDPTQPENLEKPNGRGILLMRSFMSFVEYNERGNCVVMEKVRGDDAGEES